MLGCVTCGIGLPWQEEDEEHIQVSSQEKQKHDVGATTIKPDGIVRVVRLEDQDLEYLSNKLIIERDFLLKRCTTAEIQVQRLTQARSETEEEVKRLMQAKYTSSEEIKKLKKERDVSSEEINKLKKERNNLRNALDGQVEDRDLLDTVFEWV
jgi:predicted  nucleic acid-binding Zn-ribbon protein